MCKDKRVKQKMDVCMMAEKLEKAHKLGLEVSSVCEAGLEKAIAAAREWTEDHFEAIAERRRWLQEIGAPLAGFQILRTL